MNAAVLLMTAWVAGADPVPATVQAAPITITVDGDEAKKPPAEKIAPPVAKLGTPVASPLVIDPSFPANAVATADCGACGCDCNGGQCGCGCECRPTLRDRIAGFFRRLRFWKRDECGCETDCGCDAGCCGGASATGAHGVSYLPAESAPLGNTTQPQATPAAGTVPAGSIRPVSHETAEALPATEGRAQVTMVLPAGAALFVDDQPIHAGAGETVFQTPLLKVGESYFYRVRAEVVRGGQPSREEMQVVVRAGEAVRVSFFEAPQSAPGLLRTSGR